jgi:hypothetical protein
MSLDKDLDKEINPSSEGIKLKGTPEEIEQKKMILESLLFFKSASDTNIEILVESDLTNHESIIYQWIVGYLTVDDVTSLLGISKTAAYKRRDRLKERFCLLYHKDSLRFEEFSKKSIIIKKIHGSNDIYSVGKEKLPPLKDSKRKKKKE